MSKEKATSNSSHFLTKMNCFLGNAEDQQQPQLYDD